MTAPDLQSWQEFRPAVEPLESRRLLSTGALDPSFSRDGKAFATFEGDQPQNHAVAIEGDGKILIAGATLGSNFDFAVARFNADGTPDNSFATKGQLVFSPLGRAVSGDTSEIATTIAVTPGGQIIVGGYGETVIQVNGAPVFHEVWTLARLNSNGTFDETFGTRGVAYADFGLTGNSFLRKIAFTSDGAIVGVGEGEGQAVVAQFAFGDGALDLDFNGKGYNRFRFPGAGQAALTSLAIARDGAIVVAGSAGVNPASDNPFPTDSDFAIGKLKFDGTFDTAFGPFDSGKVVVDASAILGSNDYSFDQAVGVAVDRLGRIVAGGTMTALLPDEDFIDGPLLVQRVTTAAVRLVPRPTWGMIRLTTDGDLDSTFGTGGVKKIEVPKTASPFLSAMVPFGSTRYLLTGGQGEQFQVSGLPTVMRVFDDGRVDTKFGTKGVTTVSQSGVGAFYDAAVFGNGNIALAGIQSVDRDALNFAARLQGEPATVRGTVYNDINGNGTRNSNDLGLANVKVFLDFDNNTRVDPGEPVATTDKNGNYAIANVGPGDYRLRPVPVSGFRTSYPGSGIRRISLAPAQTLGSQTFFVTSKSLVQGSVFNDDSDGDGVRDPGEDGLAGWTLLADADNDGQTDPGEPVQVTGADGNFRFINLKPGIYRIRAFAPDDADWLVTTPVLEYFDITVKAGQVITGLIFGEELV